MARNLWWSWDHDSASLFLDLDPDALERTEPQSGCAAERNSARQARNAAPPNSCCTAASTTPTAACSEYLEADRTWGAPHAGVLRPRPVAYFSAEFGLHESLPVYSGGLGVLAGDHIKSASDLDIPLVGIGLFYGQGYFRQRLDIERMAAGRISENRRQSIAHGSSPSARTASPSSLKSKPAADAIRAKVWRVKVGRCDLLLLDSDVEGNAPEDRQLTSRLYGGDLRIRIRQELLLGVGGLRALKALGISPGVLHLQRRPQRLRRAGSDSHAHGRGRHRLRRAVPRVSREVVFTTHTPVPAGHDRFDAELDRRTHRTAARSSRPLAARASWASVAKIRTTHEETFCMTVLALRLSRRANAVSALHGEVSRAMWTGLYPRQAGGRSSDRAHHQRRARPTWLAPQMFRLYDRHLGADWHEHSSEAKIWWESKMSMMASFGRRTSTSNPS